MKSFERNETGLSPVRTAYSLSEQPIACQNSLSLVITVFPVPIPEQQAAVIITAALSPQNHAIPRKQIPTFININGEAFQQAENVI